MLRMLRKISNTRWFLLLIMIALFGMYASAMSFGMFWSFDGESLLSFPIEDSPTIQFQFYLFALRFGFYASVVAILIFVIGLIRKRKIGLVISGIYFLIVNLALLLFHILIEEEILLGRVAVIGSLLLCLVLFTLLFTGKGFSKSSPSDAEDGEDEDDEKQPTKVLKKSPSNVWMIGFNIASLLTLISLFFVPLYILITPDGDQPAILINTFLGEELNFDVIIGFFVLLLALFIVFIMFMNILTVYARKDQRFLKLSTQFNKVIFICVSIFFIMGLVIKVMYAVFEDKSTIIYSYVPLAVMFVIYLSNAIVVGKTREYELENKAKISIPFFNIEPLVFLMLMTAISVGMLLLPIIRINVDSLTYTDEINMTGIDLLNDYPTLSEGYRLLAFFLHVQLLVVGFGLAIAIAAYLSKSSMFHQVIKTTTFLNIFFVFLVAISGYYFQIAQGINLEMLNNLIEHYGAGFLISSEDYAYEIETDAMLAFAGSFAVLMVMFARRVFDREELPSLKQSIETTDGSSAVQAAATEADSSPSEDTSSTSEDDSDVSNEVFDPCYSLTEIDLMKADYEAELLKRQELAAQEVSLKGLTKFIVDYAKNSRLHLSYTKSNIAAFVAGLGASKLSILQGMSGTGKTSLPKIFSEAILGNCEIVEVESSWKDKHELLGYYNEFSLKYTPKKFTISLYKATLNKDIVTFILLDEMNLSRIEYYFSDFLSLMEHEEHHRKIKLINLKLARQENGEAVEYLALERGHTLKVPPNVWFIGTANRDESTFVISDKVYDRATTMNFMKRAPKVRDYDDPISKQFYDYNTFNQLLTDAKANGRFDAEQSETIKAVERLLAPYNISFGNRILKQIEDFVNIYTECLEGENVEHEAVETILLSKVVAKLELKTIEDKEQLVIDFEKLKLLQCADFVRFLEDE